MSRVYIDGQYFETLADEVIALTFQRMTLGSLETRETDFSNTIKGPITQNNRRVLNGAEQLQSGDYPEYKGHTGTILDDSGGPLMNEGKLRLQSVTNTFNFQIYQGFRNLKEAIEGKSLWDLSRISQWDHQLAGFNVSGSWENTEGYIYGMFQDGTLIDYADGSMQKPFDLMLPSYFIHSIIEEIVLDAGFKLNKTEGLYTNERFLSLVLPFSKDKLVLSERIYPNVNLVAEEQFFTLSHPRSEPAVTAEIVGVIDFNGTTEIEFPARQIVDIKVTATAKSVAQSLSARQFTDPPIIDPSIVIIDEDDNILATSATMTSNETNLTVSLNDYTAQSGSYLRVAVAGQFFNHKVDVTLLDASVDITSEVSALEEGIIIGAEMVLPEDMSQDVLLKGILNMFCVVPDLVGNTITFRFFDEVKDNIGQTLDLSPHLIKGPESPPNQWYSEKVTRWGSYAQNNLIEYKEDDDKQENFRARTGNIRVLDETLEAEKTIITFPFAASDRYESSGGIFMMDARSATGPDEVGNFSFEGNIEQRIGYIRTERVKFRVGAISLSLTQIVPFVNFVNPNESINLHPVSLISNFYIVIREVLRRPLRLKARFDLPTRVFHQIRNNPFVPVEVDKLNGVYYVERIDSFVPGQPVTMDLIKFT